MGCAPAERDDGRDGEVLGGVGEGLIGECGLNQGKHFEEGGKTYERFNFSSLD